jgi:transcriptional regulator with PAS, ATPase and Fis domain
MCENESALLRWNSMHSGGYLSSGDPLVKTTWKQSKRLGLNPQQQTFSYHDPETFQAIKQQNRMIYAYTRRYVLSCLSLSINKEMGIALFDDNGCMLRLFGDENYLKWASSLGMAAGSKWDIAHLGANAVSAGLMTHKPVFFSGADNYCRALLPINTYFIPFSHVVVNDEKDAMSHMSLTGGLAVITPYTEQQQDYLLVGSGIANDVAIHFFMTNTLFQTFSKESLGLLTIDIDVSTGKGHFLYHNDNVLKLFHITDNIYLKDVNILFDSPPKNKRLWEILNTQIAVEEETMPISVRGVERKYIVSSVVYRHDQLLIRGIRLYIDEASRISTFISKRIGNNAQLTFANIVGRSRALLQATDYAKKVAKVDYNVLICGESGVGKDIFAQAIHNESKRRNNPFIALNCAAIPRDLFASEMFGYEEGSFTGGKRGGNIGKFELANTGTLFLDEVGEIPLDLQATLLRAIEQKSFLKLGARNPTQLDIKIIAATNADLKQKIKQKLFREDLYYRLSGLKITIPPLRERGDDIILLAEHFIRKTAQNLERTPPLLLDTTKALLTGLPWEGNVRSLQNVINSVMQLYDEPAITPQHILEYLKMNDFPMPGRHAPSFRNAPDEIVPGKAASGHTREEVERVLANNRYNRSKTADELHISRRALYRLMELYGLQ